MIERADVNQVLAQMRSMRTELQGPGDQGPVNNVAQPLNPIKGTEQTEAAQAGEAVPSFGDMLKNAIDKVNETQQTASDLRTAYEKGDPEIDIVQVMVASQKSSVAFEAMTQVRNRLVSAYQDIMKMPL